MGQTVKSEFFKGLHYFEQALPETILAKALVYGGDRNETRQGTHITDVFRIKELFNTILDRT